MKKYRAIGLMSGTSLDGLDICYCEFLFDGNWSFEILEAETIEYDSTFKKKFRDCMSYSKEELSRFDLELGTFWGKKVADFIELKNIEVDFIASHGHTVFHQPEIGITVQIGSAKEISNHTKCNVISDFRSKDVELGGQGAPLVPIGDKLLFSEYDFCLNLGGISNVSFDDEKGERRAFDISPCNLVLNHYAQQLGKEFDKDGILAKSGKLNYDLFDELNLISYFKKPSPKSLGKEDVQKGFIPLIESFNISIVDKLRTFCEHIGFQIGSKLTKGKTLVTGGGSFNLFLLDCINKNCKSELIKPDLTLISFKEALVFAFIGVLRVRNEANVLKSYTGAKEDSCSGVITNYS